MQIRDSSAVVSPWSCCSCHLMFGELASGKQKQGRPLKRFKDCVKVSISHEKLPPGSLSPVLMTGLDGEPSPDTLWTHSRCAAHRSRRPGKEERRRLMLPAVLVSSHARTVPGPASLGSDSTATSVPMADGSNAEECHHRFRWTTTVLSQALLVTGCQA